jgi:4a-hydroxytetrahydrobiopterin dehydratase
MAEKLTAKQAKTALGKLSGWKADKAHKRMSKQFVFADFNAAFAWMSRVALMAEKLDHHPEWANVYKTVDVTLTTHDTGGLSALDMEMAKFMDKTAGAAGRRK